MISPPAIELGPDLEPWEVDWACVNMNFVPEILSTPPYGIIPAQSALPVSKVRYEESVRDVSVQTYQYGGHLASSFDWNKAADMIAFLYCIIHRVVHGMLVIELRVGVVQLDFKNET